MTTQLTRQEPNPNQGGAGKALELEDASQAPLRQLKQQHMDFISSIPEEEISYRRQGTNNSDLITLYHGTTSFYLNEIFVNGLQPRETRHTNNWEDNPSHERVVYLTNKWHYFYAWNATLEFLNNHAEHSYQSLPCYIECQVPKYLLVADEDFIFTSYIKNKLIASARRRDGTTNVSLHPEECLAHYGTAGVLGGVLPSWIHSFTIIGDVNTFFSDGCQYMQDVDHWQHGKGKGKLKLKDLLRYEALSDLNGTWYMESFFGVPTIKEVFVNPVTGKIAINIETTM